MKQNFRGIHNGTYMICFFSLKSLNFQTCDRVCISRAESKIYLCKICALCTNNLNGCCRCNHLKYPILQNLDHLQTVRLYHQFIGPELARQVQSIADRQSLHSSSSIAKSTGSLKTARKFPLSSLITALVSWLKPASTLTETKTPPSLSNTSRFSGYAVFLWSFWLLIH